MVSARSDQSARVRSFLGALTASTSITECWSALQVLIANDEDEPYWSLWYQEPSRRRNGQEELLLVSEGGSRQGGTIRVAFNRLLTGRGIVGTALERHGEVTWPGPVEPASMPLVSTEGLRRIRAVAWSSEPVGVLLIGYRSDASAYDLDADAISTIGSQLLSQVIRHRREAADDVIRELILNMPDRPKSVDLLARSAQLFGERMGLRSISASVRDQEHSPHEVGIVWSQQRGIRQMTAREIAVCSLPGGSPVRLFDLSDARSVEPESARAGAGAIASQLTRRAEDRPHMLFVPFELPTIVGNRAGTFVLERAQSDMAFLPDEAAAVEVAASLVARLVGLLTRDAIRSGVLDGIMQLMANDSPSLEDALILALISIDEVLPLVSGIAIVRHDTWTEVPDARWQSHLAGDLSRIKRQASVILSEGVRSGDVLWPATGGREDEPAKQHEIWLPIVPFTDPVGALVLHVLPHAVDLSAGSEALQLLQLLGHFLGVAEEAKRVEHLRRLIEVQDQYRTTSVVSVAFAHELNHVFGRYRLRLANMRDEANLLAGRASASGDPAVRVIAKSVSDNVLQLERWAVEAERLAHVLGRSAQTNSGLEHESDPEPVYLNEVIMDYRLALDEVVKRSGPSGERKRLKLELDLDSRLAKPASSGTGKPVSWADDDSVRIGQVLVNLVSNAVRASNSGSKIEIRTTAERDGSARLVVRDYGRGMSPEVRANIFQPFFTTSSGEGGLGMGLFVVKTLLANMHADLEFDTEPGRGTTFAVRFPPREEPSGVR